MLSTWMSHKQYALMYPFQWVTNFWGCSIFVLSCD